MIKVSVVGFLLRLCLLQMQNFDVKETIQMIKKTKSEANEELEELIANGKRNENADMQKNVNGCTIKKSFKNLKTSSRTKKAISYGQPTTKVKYFRSLKKKNDLLAIWF